MFSIVYQIQQDSDAAFQQASDDAGKWIVILSLIGFSMFGVTMSVRWLRNGPLSFYIKPVVTQLAQFLPNGVTLPWTRGVTRNTQYVTVTETTNDGMDIGLEVGEDYRVTENAVTSQPVTVASVTKAWDSRDGIWPWLRTDRGIKEEVPQLWDSMLYHGVHFMLVGATQAGKTTFVKAMIQNFSRQGKVVILDPHHRWDWPLPTVGYGLNFNAVAYAMDYLQKEMVRRFDFANEKAGNIDKLEHLYIIVDEYPASASKLQKESLEFSLSLAQQSRKVKMHLIILTQNDSVKALGIEGQGKARDNFFTIYLGVEAQQYAREHYDYLASVGRLDTHPCVIQIGPDYIPMDRKFTMSLSQLPVDQGCLFEIPDLPERGDAVNARSMVKALGPANPLNLRSLSQEEVAEEVVPQPVALLPNLEEYTRGVLLVAQHENNVGLSIREFARQMGYGDGGGNHTTKAKRLLEQIYQNSGKTIPAYKSLAVTREAADA